MFAKLCVPSFEKFAGSREVSMKNGMQRAFMSVHVEFGKSKVL
jgi:hypothetical protein